MNHDLKKRTTIHQELSKQMDSLKGAAALMFMQTAFDTLQKQLQVNNNIVAAIEKLHLQALQTNDKQLGEAAHDQLRFCSIRDQALSNIIDTLLSHHKTFQENKQWYELLTNAHIRGTIAQA